MSSQRPVIGFTAELERQAGDDEGREKDRQKALSGASEGDGLALGGLEGLSSAGVSATANLQGVTSRFDWYLDRVVHFERSGTLTVNHDVVRATSDLGADCFMRQLQGCCHLRSPLSFGRATAPASSRERGFLTDWLAHDHDRLDESLVHFVGNPGSASPTYG